MRMILVLTLAVVGAQGCGSAVLKKMDRPHDMKGVMNCPDGPLDGSKNRGMCVPSKESLYDVSNPDS